MAIKAIVFDLWNTLAYNKQCRNPIIELKKELNVKDVRVLEEGFMTKPFETSEQAMLSLCDYLNIKPDEKMMKRFLGIWNDVNRELFDDVVPVLKELRKDYKLGLISNFTSFEKGFFKDMGFFDLFDSVCLSSDVGLLKPDPRIFKLMLKKHQPLEGGLELQHCSNLKK